MSVQAGVWNFDRKLVRREDLAQISRLPAEFGLESEETYFGGPVGMLYRAFHTTPESDGEHQPYIFSLGRVVTWDGRLDNRDDLSSQLLDTGGNRPDASLVAAAFERWGTDAFAKLVGDWALAIWDPTDQRLILARDYIGIRHLFYRLQPKGVCWCTQIEPLALTGGLLNVCDEYVAGYLAFHPDADLTPYREIRSILPGHFICIHNGQSTAHKYSTVSWQFKTRYKTDAEYEEHYRYLFRQAVRRRLRSTSPILAELSGGLDSTSIVCMADKILGTEVAETPRLDTFSYYDSNEPDEDDFVHFTQVPEKPGRMTFHIDLRGRGDSLCLRQATFAAVPGFGTRAEVAAALSEVVESGQYRVMLCGTGGDEMNGQPLDPRVQMADLLLGFRLIQFAKSVPIWSLRMRQPAIQLFFQTLLQILPIAIRAQLTERGHVDGWINRHFAKKYGLSARQLEVAEGLSFVKPSIRDATQTISTLARRMTYASPGVTERRYPYLDQTLVEFLTTIPSEQLLRPGQRRSLMRRALSGIVPDAILSRRTKAAAARCYSISLSRHWAEIDAVLSTSLASQFGYVDKDRVRAALLELKNGRISPYSLRLLKALSLELWLREATSRGVIANPSCL